MNLLLNMRTLWFKLHSFAETLLGWCRKRVGIDIVAETSPAVNLECKMYTHNHHEQTCRCNRRALLAEAEGREYLFIMLVESLLDASGRH